MSDTGSGGGGPLADPAPLITVFVPWIGREAFIKQTIASLTRQDYPNLEILLSDNSLAPAKSPLLEEIQDPRIRIIRRADRHLSAAEHYAACLRDARGEFVMILSDDDLIEPGYVSSMYTAIAAEPATSVCLGEQIAIDEHTNRLPTDSGPARIVWYDGVKFFLGRLLNPRRLPIITYMSLLARRTDMLQHSYRDYPDGSNSDNYMMLALSLSGKVAVSSRKMYYRIYASSAGLATPFSRLLTACAQYERDAAALLRGNRARTGVTTRLALRILIHVRNSTVMSRRLFTLYRRRLSPGQFLGCLARLSLYVCGIPSVPG